LSDAGGLCNARVWRCRATAYGRSKHYSDRSYAVLAVRTNPIFAGILHFIKQNIFVKNKYPVLKEY